MVALLRRALACGTFGKGEADAKTKITLDDPFQSITSALKQKTPVFPLPPLEKIMDTLKALPPLPGVTVLKEVTIKGKKGDGFRDKYMGKLEAFEWIIILKHRATPAPGTFHG